MALLAVRRNAIPNRLGFGALPDNIQAGTCIQWQDGAGMQVDPDGYIWINGSPTGKKQCQSYAQPDILPTVLSVPQDVMNAFAQMDLRASNLANYEDTLQDLCRQAQAYSTPSGRPMAQLLVFWQHAQAQLAGAQGEWAAFTYAQAQAQALDDAAENAYTRGNYADPQVGARILRYLQSENHAPIAFTNCNAAAECVRDALHWWATVCWNDFEGRYGVVSDNANRVAVANADVQDFIAKLKTNADRVKLTQDQVDAIARAKPWLDQLNELGQQLGALWQQAQGYEATARAGMDGDANPQAVEDAYAWMQDAQAPFIGAGETAEGLANQIHAALDKTAQDLAEYVAQHPELSGGGASAGGKGALLLGAGAIALLIAKKAALFG